MYLNALCVHEMCVLTLSACVRVCVCMCVCLNAICMCVCVHDVRVCTGACHYITWGVEYVIGLHFGIYMIGLYILNANGWYVLST